MKFFRENSRAASPGTLDRDIPVASPKGESSLCVILQSADPATTDRLSVTDKKVAGQFAPRKLMPVRFILLEAGS